MVMFREAVSFVRCNAKVWFKVAPVSIKRPFAHQNCVHVHAVTSHPKGTWGAADEGGTPPESFGWGGAAVAAPRF